MKPGTHKHIRYYVAQDISYRAGVEEYIRDLSFENPKMEIPIDLTGVERRQWVTIEKKISKAEASSKTDQFKIEVRSADVPEKKASRFFIDDIEITPFKNK